MSTKNELKNETANGTKPVLGDAFRWDEQAYDLTKEKGQIGAILFCEEMIQDEQKQINEMKFYDGERITALQNSMMDWGVIRSRVEKGFA
jgi:hypothetical protein